MDSMDWMDFLLRKALGSMAEEEDPPSSKALRRAGEDD
jgi:hypothetical protein